MKLAAFYLVAFASLAVAAARSTADASLNEGDGNSSGREDLKGATNLRRGAERGRDATTNRRRAPRALKRDTLKKDSFAEAIPLEDSYAEDIVLDFSMPDLVPHQLDPFCEPHAACHERGSACSSGTESCCGVTHNSLECTCEQSWGGRGLQYMCYHTDACFMPSCCWDGPPTDAPPPSDGTCRNAGGLCDTGVDGDYCCHDFMGGGGSYCTKTGGK